MPFPTTLDELREAGYKFTGHGKCKLCPALIEWFETPRGKKIPMDVDPKGKVVPHWKTCPNAEEFRK